MSFENTPNEIKLINKAAEKSDAGKYNVVLSNEKGTDTATINVNVVGKLSSTQCNHLLIQSCGFHANGSEYLNKLMSFFV